MNKKNAIYLLIIFTIIASCSLNNNNSESDKITIVTLKGSSATSIIFLIDSLYENDNANIEIVIKNEPMQVRSLMLQEKADFAYIPTNLAVILYNKNIPYQIAAIPVWGTLYLFGSDTNIYNWNDLIGKRIYSMAKGLTPDVMLRLLLKENGIDPNNDVIIDYSFPTHIELAQAVAAGKAELAVISEPLVSMVMQKNKNVKSLFNFSEQWSKIYGSDVLIPQTSLVVRTDFAIHNAEKVNSIMKIMKQNAIKINSNYNKSAELLVKHKILLDTSVARSTIPRSNINFVYANNVKKEILQYLEVFYKFDSNIIGGKLPDEKIFY